MSIKKITKGDNLSQSENIVETNIDKLKALFPEIVTEGKIDFKVLQEVLGNELEEDDEYYRFTWAGKANARREAQKPSTGTLRPAPEESVNWDSTQNLYIEGDNLEVLKLMQKSYAGKVKMIYIDPPYNTGKDFVYKDNYKDNLRNYQEVTGQVDEEGNKLSTNSDSDGRYHSNWLNMMYPRLRLARNLLSDDGVIFMSIDDNEVENLKKLSDEIFGADNFVAQLPTVMNLKGNNDQFAFAGTHEYTMVYSKNYEKSSFYEFYVTDKELDLWEKDEHGLFKKGANLKATGINAPRHKRPNLFFPVYVNGEDKVSLEPQDGYEAILPFTDNSEMSWRWSKEKFTSELYNLIISRNNNGISIYKKQRSESEDKPTKKPKSVFIKPEYSSGNGTQAIKQLFNDKVFDFPKPVQLLYDFLTIGTRNDDILLDLYSGSASSAHAVMQLNLEDGGNRKHIQVQLPEPADEKSEAFKSGYKTIADIGKERIRRAAKKIAEEHPEKSKNLDLGFKVFKLDTSNLKGWDGNPDNLDDSLFDAQDNIKTDRTEHDVLYEILLKYGLDLSLPIEEKVIEGKTVFSVGFGALFICLGDNLSSKVAEGIGAWKEELQPEVCRVVFKDSGFTDVEKTNSVQILKRFGVEEVRSI